MSTISGREVGNNQMCSQASEDLLFSSLSVRRVGEGLKWGKIPIKAF